MSATIQFCSPTAAGTQIPTHRFQHCGLAPPKGLLAVNALAVALLDECAGVKFANVVTDGPTDELVDGPNKQRDNEPSEPCPAARAENTRVTEIEDTKRQDIKK